MRRLVLGFACVVAIVGAAGPASAFSPGYGAYYRSSDGSLVHRPYHTDRHIEGETAVCRDGTHSMSRHHRGTCSRHGGVAHWG